MTGEYFIQVVNIRSIADLEEKYFPIAQFSIR